MAARRFVLPGILVALALGTFSSGCSGGGGAKGTELIIINQNVLHGLGGNEDPSPEPYDRFAERIQLIADGLAKEQPDVVQLQEVIGDPAEDYPDVRGIVLGALGPSYTAAFGDFLGDTIDTGGLGQMTFTNHPLLNTANRSVSAIRSAVHVSIQTEAGVVELYNVHLEGTGAVLETDEDQAITEVQHVIDFIDETRTDGAAVILTGDFNAKPNDPSIQHVLQAGFIDALADAGDATCAQAGDPGCTNSNIPLGDNPDRNADQRIDYIFVMAGADVAVEVEEARLFLGEPQDIGGGHTLWASDHIGVLAVLRLTAKGE